MVEETEGSAAANTAWLNQERESMHRKMLSAVSHDLKTPLASVIGSLEVMERMKDRLSPEKQRELFAVALQEAYRLDSFVTNILDMAKLESGSIKPQRENVVCAVMVRQAVARMGHRLAHSDVTMLDENPGLAFSSDAMLLARALNLLLDNAVKYGGEKPAITIAFGRAEEGAYISVSDEGEGVPADKVDSLFCKYTRIAKQDTQVAGTGLGLAICRAIMTVLGGTVSASANSPRGMVFTLKIPVAS
ncbi:MAG: ATP-binding protein [Alphaproteobacteria bacterium]|nr:ATP-binding protein [Alphaproteobacteria bacterium]